MIRLAHYIFLIIALSSCIAEEQNDQEIYQDSIMEDDTNPESANKADVEIQKKAPKTSYLDLKPKELQDILTVLPIADTSLYHFYNRKYTTSKDSFWVIQAMSPIDSFTNQFDIYLVQKSHLGYELKLTINTEKEAFMDYRVYDTIMDVNFDGYEDYMTYYYSGTGCCPRDSRNAYLNGPNGFSQKDVHLFNPGFDTLNHTILQMGYGHVPYLDVSKSVWVGDSLQKIESIVHNINYSDTILKYKSEETYVIYYEDGTSKALKEIPDEYYLIPALAHWFAGRVDEAYLNP